MLQISENELQELRAKLDNIFGQISRLADELAFMNNLLDTRNPTTRAPVLSEQQCPNCDGKGYWIDTTALRIECGQCEGTGIANRPGGG